MTDVLPPSKPAHPWRKTLRTVVQAALAFAALSPLLYRVASNGADPAEATGVMAAILTAMAAATRLFNTPAVEQFLKKFAPWLSASDIQRDEARAVINDGTAQLAAETKARRAALDEPPVE